MSIIFLCFHKLYKLRKLCKKLKRFRNSPSCSFGTNSGCTGCKYHCFSVSVLNSNGIAAIKVLHKHADVKALCRAFHQKRLPTFANGRPRLCENLFPWGFRNHLLSCFFKNNISDLLRMLWAEVAQTVTMETVAIKLPPQRRKAVMNNCALPSPSSSPSPFCFYM